MSIRSRSVRVMKEHNSVKTISGIRGQKSHEVENQSHKKSYESREGKSKGKKTVSLLRKWKADGPRPAKKARSRSTAIERADDEAVWDPRLSESGVSVGSIAFEEPGHHAMIV